MATFYVCSNNDPRSASYNMRGPWAISTTYAVGDLVVPRRGYGTAAAKKYVYECISITTGISGGSEPTWGYGTPGTTTTTDGGVTWRCEEADDADHATYFLDNLMNGSSTRVTGGDTIYVYNTHAEIVDSQITFNTSAYSKRVNVLCVSSFSSPALSTGATVTITSNNSISLSAFAYIYGISFIESGSQGTQYITVTNGCLLDNCKLTLGTNSATYIAVGSGRLIDCILKFGHTSQYVQTNSEIIGPSSTYLIDNAGSIPSALFRSCNGGVVRDADLSNINTTLHSGGGTNNNRCTFINCKLHASYSIGMSSSGLNQSILINCDPGGDNPISYQSINVAATEDEDATIYRDNGASDGTSSFSHKVVTTANTTFTGDYILDLLAFNNTTGSSVTATVYWCLDSAGTALKKGECWLEIEYLGTSGYTLGTIAKDVCGDAITPSTTDQNTDNVSTWTGATNPTKQYAQVSFTPQYRGLVRARLHFNKPSTTIYVDPVLYLA